MAYKPQQSAGRKKIMERRLHKFSPLPKGELADEVYRYGIDPSTASPDSSMIQLLLRHFDSEKRSVIARNKTCQFLIIPAELRQAIYESIIENHRQEVVRGGFYNAHMAVASDSSPRLCKC